MAKGLMASMGIVSVAVQDSIMQESGAGASFMPETFQQMLADSLDLGSRRPADGTGEYPDPDT